MKFLSPLLFAALLGIAPIVPLSASPEAAEARAQENKVWRAKLLSMLEKGQFAELETIILDLRKEKASLYDAAPTGRFYGTFDIEGKAKEEVWQKRKAELDAWAAAVPDSLAVKTLLIDWWIGYAWKARGTGWASTVTEEGWTLMRERLAEARKIYEAVEAEGKVDDAYFYNYAITIGLGQNWSFKEVADVFKKGIAIDPNCLKLYKNVAYVLTPKWGGSTRAQLKFAELGTQHLEGEDADFVYAEILTSAVEDDDRETSLFAMEPGAYERIKRGLEIGQKRAATYWMKAEWASELARFASLKGDDEIARSLFLEWGREIRAGAVFGGRENMLFFRDKSGAEAKLREAYELERAGKLAEAEAMYRSFSTQPNRAGWLRSFYQRHGMVDQMISMGGKSLPQSSKGLSITQVHALIFPAMTMGQWDLAEEAAREFNDKRPWNLSGLGPLFICAAHRGDKEATQKLYDAFIANKTNRPALKNAQAILRGEKTWQELAPELSKGGDGGYNIQAAITVIGWYLAEGKPEEAAQVLNTLRPSDFGYEWADGPQNLINSLDVGVLRTLFQTPQQ